MKKRLFLLVFVFLIVSFFVSVSLVSAWSWDILDENCSSFTAPPVTWVDNHAGTGESIIDPVDPAGQFRFLAHDNWAQRWATLTLPDDYTIEFLVYFDILPSSKSCRFCFENGITKTDVKIYSNLGIYVHDGQYDYPTDDKNNYADSSWHTIRFLVTGGDWETATVDIYVDEEKTVDAADCSSESANEKVALGAHGSTVEMHVDYIKIATGLHAPFSPPTQTENNGSYATNLSALNETTIQSVSLYTWHKDDKAKIVFSGDTNLSGISDLDPIIEVDSKFVFVNISAAPALNKSSNLTFYGIDCNDADAKKVYYSVTESTFSTVIGKGALCTPTTDPSCTVVSCDDGANGNLTITVSHFTGFVAGDNANLTIYDEIEVSGVKYPNDAIKFYANYTNKTSGDHISGASCNITFDDYPGTWYVMNEGASNYNYTKSGGFSTAGTRVWNVTCDHDDFNKLTTNDTVVVTETPAPPPVPEFSTITALLALVIVISGFLIKTQF